MLERSCRPRQALQRRREMRETSSIRAEQSSPPHPAFEYSESKPASRYNLESRPASDSVHNGTSYIAPPSTGSPSAPSTPIVACTTIPRAPPSWPSGTLRAPSLASFRTSPGSLTLATTGAASVSSGASSPFYERGVLMPRRGQGRGQGQCQRRRRRQKQRRL